MPRKLKDWMEAFNDWTLPRSESPVSFHTFAGYFALSALVRRRVKLSRKILGRYDIYPTLYIMFVGPAGGPRKSTSMDEAVRILDEIPNLVMAADAPTKEVLIKRIKDSPDSSIIIPSSEFAQFIMKSGYEMYDVLTNLFDNRKRLTQDTFARDLELAENPCGILLGCTTPDWIADNMPENVIGGGFASRVIFVYEQDVRRRKIFYDDVDYDVIDKLHVDLLADAMDISNNVAGECTFSPEAKEYVRDWYESGAYKTNEDSGNSRLDGYYNRKHIHVIKLAQLRSISQSNNLIIELEHVNRAIKDIEEMEKTLPQTFKHIGKNQYVSDVDRIRDFILAKGKVERKELIREFLHTAEPDKLASLLGTVVIVFEKQIEVVRELDKTFYVKRAL